MLTVNWTPLGEPVAEMVPWTVSPTRGLNMESGRVATYVEAGWLVWEGAGPSTPV